jgi:DNA-binding protein HU-beta
MNKTDLINAVAEASELSKKDATKAVDAVFDTILDALKNGDKVQLIGFGNFEVRERAARKGRNPQTGEEIEIAASKVPAFKYVHILVTYGWNNRSCPVPFFK